MIWSKLHVCCITIRVLFGLIPKRMYGHEQKWYNAQRGGIRNYAMIFISVSYYILKHLHGDPKHQRSVFV